MIKVSLIKHTMETEKYANTIWQVTTFDGFIIERNYCTRLRANSMDAGSFGFRTMFFCTRSLLTGWLYVITDDLATVHTPGLASVPHVLAVLTE